MRAARSREVAMAGLIWRGMRCGVAALALASAVLSAAAISVRAQDAYPSRPVHLLVPFPPGGAVDIVARSLGDELSKRWGGASIVVENRPGAGGTIAEDAAA